MKNDNTHSTLAVLSVTLLCFSVPMVSLGESLLFWAQHGYRADTTLLYILGENNFKDWIGFRSMLDKTPYWAGLFCIGMILLWGWLFFVEVPIFGICVTCGIWCVILSSDTVSYWAFLFLCAGAILLFILDRIAP